MTSFRLLKPSTTSTLITLLMILQISACSTEKFAEAVADNIISGASSIDVFPIDLPTCGPADPEVRFIEENGDWADINDPSYRVFCVHPGDYTGQGTIRITADGAPGNERWIRLYDPLTPNDESTHPVAVNDTRRAVVLRFLFGYEGDPANNWVVDRITKRGSYAHTVHEGSARVIFNRMLLERGDDTLFSVSNAKDVTLQNSVLRQTMVVPNADRHCINIDHNHHGVRIINNEIYDCAGDGVQFGPNAIGGASIFNNDIYITPALYSDCHGNLNPNGSCACAENAIDMKGPGWAIIYPTRARVGADRARSNLGFPPH